MTMVVKVIFKFNGINNPDSEEATAKIEEITEDCETMRVAFDASECFIDDALCEADEEDFALVAEYEEKQHAMELEDYDNFTGLRDNTDPVTKVTRDA